MSFYLRGGTSGGVFASAITSSVASGSDALTLTTGQRAHLGGGATDYLFSDGTYVSFAGKFKSPATDTSGTPGSATANTPAGVCAIAAASSAAITITNSVCTAASIVLATVATADATCKSVQVVPAAGSFVITPNAATTGITKVTWFVIN